MSRAWRSYKYRLVTAVVGLIASGAATTIVLVSGAAAQSKSASAGVSDPAVNPAIAAQISVFDRAPVSSDALPAAFSSQLQIGSAYAGPDVSDSRRVSADDGQAAYLVPAQEGLCVINTNESFCSPPATLAGAAVVDLCSPTLPLGQLELEWLLPDGATNVAVGMSDGSNTGFAPGYNVYIARLPLNSSSPIPKTIDWDDSAGHHHSVNAPIPSGAQNETCLHPGQAPSQGGPSAPIAQTVTGPATPIGP